MKIAFNFKKLHAAVEKMKPEKKGAFYYYPQMPLPDLLNAKLKVGIDVPLNQIDFEMGLSRYQDRHVIFYVKDHGDNLLSVLDDPEMYGRKVHFWDCVLLKEAIEKGGIERYIVTNDDSGQFMISGYDFNLNKINEKAKLKICKSCLKKSNYKGYALKTPKEMVDIYQDFDLSDFFRTYSVFFPESAELKTCYVPEGYPVDWRKISTRYKTKMNYVCEGCGVKMSDHKMHLYTLHRNGDFLNNDEENLKNVCTACYMKEMPSSPALMFIHLHQTLTRLRQKQGLILRNSTWDDVFYHSEPGLHPLLYYCKEADTDLPEMGYSLKQEKDESALLFDLAWPKHRFAVMMDPRRVNMAKVKGWEIYMAKIQGWEVFSVKECLDNPEKLKTLMP